MGYTHVAGGTAAAGTDRILEATVHALASQVDNHGHSATANGICRSLLLLVSAGAVAAAVTSKVVGGRQSYTHTYSRFNDSHL